MLLPIVANDYDTHAETSILALVPFDIEDAQGGNQKYIQGHFVPRYNVPGSTGSTNATNFGAVTFNGSKTKLLN